MQWLERLNQAITYIEEQLTETLDIDRAAQIACCSTYHFQRMFSYLAGVSLSEYIRRRRMTKAALQLQTSNCKVIDIALMYGYESPTAFTRAFEGIHGISPTAAREQGAALRAFPPITFTISIKGEQAMEYRIETKEAFTIVGVKQPLSGTIEESFAQVPVFWQKQFALGTIPKLCGLMNQPPFGVMGVSTSMQGEDIDYYIAVSSDQPAPEGMDEYMVPACTWAIFTCVGPMPQAMQQMQRRIISEWLPTSGYEYADAPDIEVYSEGDQTAADYRTEIWLPIRKVK